MSCFFLSFIIFLSVSSVTAMENTAYNVPTQAKFIKKTLTSYRDLLKDFKELKTVEQQRRYIDNFIDEVFNYIEYENIDTGSIKINDTTLSNLNALGVSDNLQNELRKSEFLTIQDLYQLIHDQISKTPDTSIQAVIAKHYADTLRHVANYRNISEMPTSFITVQVGRSLYWNSHLLIVSLKLCKEYKLDPQSYQQSLDHLLRCILEFSSDSYKEGNILGKYKFKLTPYHQTIGKFQFRIPDIRKIPPHILDQIPDIQIPHNMLNQVLEKISPWNVRKRKRQDRDEGAYREHKRRRQIKLTDSFATL